MLRAGEDALGLGGAPNLDDFEPAESGIIGRRGNGPEGGGLGGGRS